MFVHDVERITRQVYGETFARYNTHEFKEFIKPLQVRLALNGIKLDVFAGKRCLDAGCGGGRATALMALAGAKEVVAYDLSRKNVATALKKASELGLTRVRGQSGSLLEIPYRDGEFDVVWCNGVLHHTRNPDLALREVLRVLKVGGYLWLYLYGAGGIYWFLVDFFRRWLRATNRREAITYLAVTGTPTGRLAEFIDDWYVPVLRRYTHRDVSRRLKELGVPHPAQLKAGMSYDTSHRRRNTEDRIWMGEGDLRYWGRKTSRPSASTRFRLPDLKGRGSRYSDAPELLQLDADLRKLSRAVTRVESMFPSLRGIARIAIAARMQTWIRDTLSNPRPFNSEALSSWIDQRLSELRQPA